MKLNKLEIVVLLLILAKGTAAATAGSCGVKTDAEIQRAVSELIEKKVIAVGPGGSVTLQMDLVDILKQNHISEVSQIEIASSGSCSGTHTDCWSV